MASRDTSSQSRAGTSSQVSSYIHTDPSHPLLLPTPSTLQKPSVLDKSWTLPPRPKPGRKACLDDPPTKRKAQNRAAQRAFRQRKAAKVGELEDQMKATEKEEKREQEDLKNRLERLQVQVESYDRALKAWQKKCEWLENELTLERQSSCRQSGPVEGSFTEHGSNIDTIPLPTRKPQPSHNNLGEEVSMGCGRCSENSRCECIEQAIDIGGLVSSNVTASPIGETQTSSRVGTHEEYSKPITESAEHDTDFEMEIDFTTKPSHPPLVSESNGKHEVPDACGFCSDDTPCLCAEMNIGRSNNPNSNNSMRPSFSQFTPPPEEHDSVGRHLENPNNPCVNGPGTCDQCLSDPRSTLFCKSLAATRRCGVVSSPIDASKSGTASCGKPGGCCRESQRWDRGTQPTITCADTYTALKRHPNFDQAFSEMGSWMSQLNAGTAAEGIGGRTAYEIESARVLETLKYFDTRFGTKAP